VDADTVRRLLGHSASSRMLEAVYDKPKASDLAARAGSLDAAKRQLDDALGVSAEGDSHFGKPKWARGAEAEGPDSSISREIRTVDPVGDGWIPVAIDTDKRHSPAAHSLALAFASVLTRGAA
jgi:hypothetical protein